MARGNLKTLLALGVMGLGGIFLVTSFSTGDLSQTGIGLAISFGGFLLLGTGRGRSREDNAVAFDLIAVAITAIFFLIFIVALLSGLLANAQQAQNIAQFLLIMEIGGIAMTLVSGVLRLSPSVSKKQFGNQMLYIAANFAGFFILDLIVPPTTYRILGQPLSGLSGSSFITVMIAVPETTVFQVWLAPWLSNISRTGPLGGSFMAAIIATAYHLFVLGTNPAALGIVFGSFFILGFTAIKSGSAGVPLTNHLINNALKVSGLL